VDSDGDHKADAMYTLLEKFQELPNGKKSVMPMGVVFTNGSLYVAAAEHLLRFDDIESKLDAPGAPVIVVDDVPRGKIIPHLNAKEIDGHFWHYLGLGPDNKLYIPLGSPYDIGENIPELMQIIRMNLDGSERETYVRGIRNVMGMDFHPKTGDLWFTDNGVDHLGDNLPHEELNRVSKQGEHFGHPYVFQGDIVDEKYVVGKDPKDFVAPAQLLNPHGAPMGMTFYTGTQFPKKYKNAIFVAERNGEKQADGKRVERESHRVALVTHNDKKGKSYEPFLTGFMEGDAVWGKPYDIEVMADGSILVSDDTANAVYRITY
jgi:glucose/arabinose dehydrogenase